MSRRGRDVFREPARAVVRRHRAAQGVATPFTASPALLAAAGVGIAFAVVAVVLTSALVAWIGWGVADLPFAAAVALGAIVALPDADALGTVSIPASTDAVPKGESLFNGATAVLLFGAALALQTHGGLRTARSWGA